MSILMITSSFPSDRNDSEGIIIARFAETLEKFNHRIVILAPHMHNLPYRYTYGSVIVYRFLYFFPPLENLTHSPGIFYHFNHTILGKIQIPFLLICELFASIIICRKEKVRLIHSHWILPHGLIGVMTSSLLSIPHICSIHGTDVTIIRSYPVLKTLIREISKKCTFVTVNSRYNGDILMSCSNTISSPTIIPMGAFNHSFQLKDLNPINNSKNILYVGRLIPLKGVHFLIQAIKKVCISQPSIHVIIIGDGPEKGNLEELSRTMELEQIITFPGRQGRDALLNYYHQADLFVLPSIIVNGQTEGLGVVLLEAMASGVPVIGSNTGGIPDIIEDGVNGLLVPPGDPDALADAIIRILTNPDLAERFRVAGLETVRERFSWNTIGDQFCDLYNQILLDS